jgi:hypothetical protein
MSQMRKWPIYVEVDVQSPQLQSHPLWNGPRTVVHSKGRHLHGGRSQMMSEGKGSVCLSAGRHRELALVGSRIEFTEYLPDPRKRGGLGNFSCPEFKLVHTPKVRLA